jgi:hypothetical protein
MEAETQWRGIISANKSTQTKFNSNEFVKLCEPMRLQEYAISFLDYPDLEPIKPFAAWRKSDPTESLAWYTAYHGVKHNRESEFEKGTLQRAFEAVSACICLLVAQFGQVALSFEISSFVQLETPNWAITEMYLSGFSGPEWKPVAFPGL